MKKILIIMCMFFVLPVMADTMPFYVESIPRNVIGMYQTGDSVKIYSHPEANSEIVKEIKFSYEPEEMPDNVFAVLINEKKLGFLYVSNVGDEGWVEVIYNRKTGAKGWVLTEDKLQFLPWLNFYNLYGRKYGLRFMKDSPDDLEILKAKSEDLSQTVSTLRYVKQIRLTAIRGNWALVSVVDVDRTPKMGYLRWRGDDGTIYAFPNIK